VPWDPDRRTLGETSAARICCRGDGNGFGRCSCRSSATSRSAVTAAGDLLLISLQLLRAQERVRFKTAVLMYKATHGTAPSYLSQLVRVADLPGRRRSLRSARTNRLLVPPVKLSTVGGRAFPVTGPTTWNSLPDNVMSSPSLSTFRQRFCSRPRFLTLSLIPGKLSPASSGR